MSRQADTTYASEIMRLNPLRYFPLADAVGSSTATDASASAQNGTVNGTVTFGQAPLLKASTLTSALFDGASGYLSAASTGLYGAGQDITVGAIITTSSFADDGGGVGRRAIMLNMGGGYSVQIATAPGGIWVFDVNEASSEKITSHTGYNTGVAYILIGTYIHSSNNPLLYVNGAAVSNNGGASGYGVGASGFNIGRRTDSAGYFPGTMAHVFILNYALTPDQIAWLYHVSQGAGSMQSTHRPFAGL